MKQLQWKKLVVIIPILIVIMWGLYSYSCICEAKTVSVAIECEDSGRAGSGVIISSNLIITAKHVVEDANIINIILQNYEVVQPRTVYIDPNSDIAALEVNYNFDKWAYLSDEQLHFADFVFGIGNAENMFGSACSIGFVYEHNYKRMFFDYDDMIMVYATSYSGCSGGGLYHYNRLVGMVTAVYGKDYTFALNSKEIIEFLKEMELEYAT